MTGRLWRPLSAMGQDVECDARGSTPFVVVREKLAQGARIRYQTVVFPFTPTR